MFLLFALSGLNMKNNRSLTSNYMICQFYLRQPQMESCLLPIIREIQVSDFLSHAEDQ